MQFSWTFFSVLKIHTSEKAGDLVIALIRKFLPEVLRSE